AAVESLLAADEGATGFLETPIDEFAATLIRGATGVAGELEPGTRVGPYRVVRVVGRGGMGAVDLADRDDGQFEQRVALKLIRRGTDTREAIGRFLRERQILARLEHPHIARLLDGGVTDDGRPFFAMEYVEGERITDYCDARRLDVGAR